MWPGAVGVLDFKTSALPTIHDNTEAGGNTLGGICSLKTKPCRSGPLCH